MKARDARWLLGAALAVGALVAGGCPPTPPQVCPANFLSVEQILDAYNQNAAKVPNLWGRIQQIEVRLRGEGGDVDTYRIDRGHLFLSKVSTDPLDTPYFLVRGVMGNQEIFRLGTTAEQRPPGAAAAAPLYYFQYEVSEDQRGAYWGHVSGLYGPGGGTTTIDPVQLLSVLGVMPWPQGPGQPPFPMLTVHADPCAYIVHFALPRPGGGLYVQREVWLDRASPTPRPVRVRLYDWQGRMVMQADLSDYQPVAAEGDPPGWPVMPGTIDITWPLVEQGLTGLRLEVQEQDLATRALAPGVYDVPDTVFQQGQYLQGAPALGVSTREGE